MEIVGTVSNITFRSEDSGYSVVRLSTGIIAVGTMPFVAVGGEYKFFGRFVNHAKHGEQFEIAKYEILPPDSESKIAAFIGGGLIYGVGPVTAKKIVRKFGKNTLDIMANSPEKLSAVRGISPAKAQKIGEEYKQIQSLQGVVMYFAKFEISLNMAIKIYKQYGDSAVAAASRNPYALIETVDGLGFLTADKMAKTLGVSHNSSFRVRAGIVYSLSQSAETDGDTYLPLPVLSKSVCRLPAVRLPACLTISKIAIIFWKQRILIWKPSKLKIPLRSPITPGLPLKRCGPCSRRPTGSLKRMPGSRRKPTGSFRRSPGSRKKPTSSFRKPKRKLRKAAKNYIK
jgi:hypothetical protein